jgi:hypothetical protein
VRKGRAINVTIEHECVDILHALCPSGKSYGRLLSELLRREEQRRHDARKLRERLVAVADEVDTP